MNLVNDEPDDKAIKECLRVPDIPTKVSARPSKAIPFFGKIDIGVTRFIDQEMMKKLLLDTQEDK